MQETQETEVQSLGLEDPLEQEMATYSVFLPGESQGERGLAGYSPWARKESDTMERLSTHAFIPYVISVFFSLWCPHSHFSQAVH